MGKFDILYLPRDFENHQNKGYFHINFRNAPDAEVFAQWVQSGTANMGAGLGQSKKPLSMAVCRASVQGFHDFVSNFVTARRLRTKNPDNLPWIYYPEAFSPGQPLTTETIQKLPSNFWNSSSV